MPIRQERLIAVIRAADDFSSTCTRMRETISSQIESVKAGRCTNAEALANIDLICDPSIMIPGESIAILLTEKAHFRLNASRNRRARAAAERVRRAAGIQPRQPSYFDQLYQSARPFDPKPSQPRSPHPDIDQFVDEELARTEAERLAELQREANEPDFDDDSL
jgi:hypothetical protein